jgi:hypothetical protein
MPYETNISLVNWMLHNSEDTAIIQSLVILITSYFAMVVYLNSVTLLCIGWDNILNLILLFWLVLNHIFCVLHTHIWYIMSLFCNLLKIIAPREYQLFTFAKNTLSTKLLSPRI